MHFRRLGSPRPLPSWLMQKTDHSSRPHITWHRHAVVLTFNRSTMRERKELTVTYGLWVRVGPSIITVCLTDNICSLGQWIYDLHAVSGVPGKRGHQSASPVSPYRAAGINPHRVKIEANSQDKTHPCRVWLCEIPKATQKSLFSSSFSKLCLCFVNICVAFMFLAE